MKNNYAKRGTQFSQIERVAVSDEQAKWLLSCRGYLIRLLRSWCSDFSIQDAEDVVSMLFERICRTDIRRALGELTESNLVFHLRREKENFRRRRGRIKRGGNAVHLDWSTFSNDSSLGSEKDPILTRSDYRLLDDYLQLLRVDSEGRLKVVVLVMRRVLDCYQTPSDLVEVMTGEERELFHPCDGRVLIGEELEEFILKAVMKTLEKLRKRLRELREQIPMN